jgi:hypothetical protein
VPRAQVIPFYEPEEETKEDVMKCECQFCNQLIEFDTLNDHEEVCERKMSENKVTEILNRPPDVIVE